MVAGYGQSSVIDPHLSFLTPLTHLPLCPFKTRVKTPNCDWSQLLVQPLITLTLNITVAMETAFLDDVS